MYWTETTLFTLILLLAALPQTGFSSWLMMPNSILPAKPKIWGEQVTHSVYLSSHILFCCHVKLGRLLSLGLGWPGPLQRLNNLKFLSHHIYVLQALPSQQAVAPGHSQSGQFPVSLGARSEACSALLLLKPEQDYSYFIPLTDCSVIKTLQ